MRLQSCLLVCLALLLLGCGSQSSPDISSTEFPDIAELEQLSRDPSAIEVTQVDGADAITSSGEPSAHIAEPWMVLDGDQATGVSAWAIWRITLADGQTPLSIDVTFQSIGVKRYWLAYADFAAERWQFLSEGANEFGISNALAHIEPDDPGVLLSPTRAIYVAVLARGGQSPNSIINVAGIEATYETEGGGDPAPIFDDFENNDTMETCYMLDAGAHLASLHQSWRSDMAPPEQRDMVDLYCIDIPAGKDLTVTLRHEPQDHFNPDPSPADYTDLDLLLYPDNAVSYLDDFIEQYSSFGVFYGFEQSFAGSLSGEYKLGVLAAIQDGYDDNAEYELQIFYSDVTYTVSGMVNQDSLPVDKKFVVFLEPGNFNDVTWFDGDEDAGQRGEFDIRGVPPGDYVLKVQGSAGFYQTGHVYSTTKNVTVNGNETVDINIEPFPDA